MYIYIILYLYHGIEANKYVHYQFYIDIYSSQELVQVPEYTPAILRVDTSYFYCLCIHFGNVYYIRYKTSMSRLYHVDLDMRNLTDLLLDLYHVPRDAGTSRT